MRPSASRVASRYAAGFNEELFRAQEAAAIKDINRIVAGIASAVKSLDHWKTESVSKAKPGDLYRDGTGAHEGALGAVRIKYTRVKNVRREQFQTIAKEALHELGIKVKGPWGPTGVRFENVNFRGDEIDVYVMYHRGAVMIDFESLGWMDYGVTEGYD